MDYPIWLQIVLALSMSMALAGLGAWLFCTSAVKAIKEANKLEGRRTRKETEALDNWKTAYEAEHQDHIEDVADLINENTRLMCENKRLKELCAKVKVKDL